MVRRSRRNRGPNPIRPLARALFLLLAAGFTITALGIDPTDITRAWTTATTGSTP